MKASIWAVLLVLLASASECYKILFFIPRFGVSHIRFSGRLADVLSDAGHEVHVYQPIVDESIQVPGFTPSKMAKVFYLPKKPGDYPSFTVHEKQDEIWEGMPISSQRNLGLCKGEACEAVLNDTKNLDLLRAENYDLVVTEYFEPCGYGVIKAIGAKKYVTTWSCGLHAGLTGPLGVKSHWSYHPGLSTLTTEKMTFLERVKSFIGFFADYNLLRPLMVKYATQAIQKHFPEFDLSRAIAGSAFIFINSEEHVEYTVPLTPKIIRIPNMYNVAVKPLTGKISEIVESPESRGFVLLSLGTIVHSASMPAHVKTAFLEAFAEFPDVTFFWKYENPEDGTAADIPNVYTEKWLPQRDLLYHPKLLAFITHAGQNSVSEAAAAGVPMIALPLFADQPKNGKMVEYREMVVYLDHKTLTKEKVVDALQAVLNNEKYKEKARLISRMIEARPLSTKETFIKHIEFAAEFGDTGTLSAEGANQNVFVFYSLDVIGFLVGVVLIVIFVLKSMVTGIFRIVKSKFVKTKQE
uniref:UDP-glucuronosyltransferase n=1 Tax=Panagrellus redivivus TaxID=6233 RepID=A0A7E4W5C8_PANRE